jgi:hypothetical protein
MRDEGKNGISGGRSETFRGTNGMFLGPNGLSGDKNRVFEGRNNFFEGKNSVSGGTNGVFWSRNTAFLGKNKVFGGKIDILLIMPFFGVFCYVAYRVLNWYNMVKSND